MMMAHYAEVDRTVKSEPAGVMQRLTPPTWGEPMRTANCVGCKLPAVDGDLDPTRGGSTKFSAYWRAM